MTMTTKQANKLKMYLAVRNYLKANTEITDTLPNFSEFMEELDAAILQILTNSELSQYSNMSSTEAKIQLRTKLEDGMLDDSHKLRAYALYVNNVKLAEETRFTESYLRKATELEIIDIGRGLYSRINDNLASLTTYGLTATTQTTLKLKIDTYANAIPESRQVQVDKKESNRLIAEGVTDADDALDDISALVEIVHTSKPDFYSGYKSARQVIDSGTTTLQVQGEATDATTGEPIADAVFTFCLSGQKEVVLTKHTAAKGGFNEKSLAEGVYDVTVTKVGYKPETVSATVSSDKLCVIEVRLTKI